MLSEIDGKLTAKQQNVLFLQYDRRWAARKNSGFSSFLPRKRLRDSRHYAPFYELVNLDKSPSVYSKAQWCSPEVRVFLGFFCCCASYKKKGASQMLLNQGTKGSAG